MVSTICDQAPTNVAVINRLYKETNQMKSIKENVEKTENLALTLEINKLFPSMMCLIYLKV